MWTDYEHERTVRSYCHEIAGTRCDNRKARYDAPRLLLFTEFHYCLLYYHHYVRVCKLLTALFYVT